MAVHIYCTNCTSPVGKCCRCTFSRQLDGLTHLSRQLARQMQVKWSALIFQDFQLSFSGLCCKDQQVSLNLPTYLKPQQLPRPTQQPKPQMLRQLMQHLQPELFSGVHTMSFKQSMALQFPLSLERIDILDSLSWALSVQTCTHVLQVFAGDQLHARHLCWMPILPICTCSNALIIPTCTP